MKKDWISVRTALPVLDVESEDYDMSIEVLVFDHKNQKIRTGYIKRAKYSGIKSWTMTDGFNLGHEITHWDTLLDKPTRK